MYRWLLTAVVMMVSGYCSGWCKVHQIPDSRSKSEPEVKKARYCELWLNIQNLQYGLVSGGYKVRVSPQGQVDKSIFLRRRQKIFDASTSSIQELERLLLLRNPSWNLIVHLRSPAGLRWLVIPLILFRVLTRLSYRNLCLTLQTKWSYAGKDL